LRTWLLLEKCQQLDKVGLLQGSVSEQQLGDCWSLPLGKEQLQQLQRVGTEVAALMAELRGERWLAGGVQEQLRMGLELANKKVNIQKGWPQLVFLQDPLEGVHGLFVPKLSPTGPVPYIRQHAFKDWAVKTALEKVLKVAEQADKVESQWQQQQRRRQGAKMDKQHPWQQDQGLVEEEVVQYRYGSCLDQA
jgi:hypothetical protein